MVQAHQGIGNENLAAVLANNNISIRVINKILHTLKNYEFPEEIRNLPSDFRTLAHPYNVPIIKNIDNNNENLTAIKKDSQFLYFGIKKGLKYGWAKFNKNQTELSLYINVDGVSLHKSSSYELWPIIGRFDTSPVFLIALWWGRGKPTSCTGFLSDFVNEFITLHQNGMKIDGNTYSIKLSGAHFDSPARSFVLNTHYFNSTDGCYKCEVKGEYCKETHRMYFIHSSINLRSREYFMKPTNKKAQCSLIMNIPGFNPVTDSPLDPMHLIDLGVMKKLWFLWTSTTNKLKRNGYVFHSGVRDILNNRISKISTYCPREFSRKPRTTEDSSHFKAKEFRNILLYTGPVILNGLLDSKKYNHFLSLHVAVRFLEMPSLISDKVSLQYAEDLLLNFVGDFQHIYQKDLVSFNVHGLVHVVDDVRKYGRLSSYSSYSFESYLGKLSGLVHSGQHAAMQVPRRLHEIHKFPETDSKSIANRLRTAVSASDETLPSDFPQVSSKTRLYYTYESKLFFFDGNNTANKYCEINEAEILEIKYFVHDEANNIVYICGYFMKKIGPIYSVPCPSSHVDIFAVELIENKNLSLKAQNFQNVTGKFYPMPWKENSLALAKLL